ncbi:MAG: hypothetical protein HY942_09515 [Gammaproteobacteria bacterium]|nr:hypothetical protein [Gammaproteobacteria bacterium]
MTRTVIALALIALPLQPLYGVAEGAPHAGDNPRVSEAAHAGPAALIVSDHSHAGHDHDHAGSPAQNNGGDDPLCDGNCMSCTVGAMLASALFPVSLSGSDRYAAIPAARIEIVLPTKTHPPQVPA